MYALEWEAHVIIIMQTSYLAVLNLRTLLTKTDPISKHKVNLKEGGVRERGEEILDY